MNLSTVKWAQKQEMMDHIQIICTSLQTDNHASTSSQFFTGRMPFLPSNKEHQTTEGKTVIIN